MLISDFDYHLPPHRIASHPPPKRGQTNLLVLNRHDGSISHRRYSDLPAYLQPGDVLILNDTKVIKARLIANSPTGKPKEFLLLESHSPHPDPHTALALTFGKNRVGDTYTLKPQPSSNKAPRQDGLLTDTPPNSDRTRSFSQPPLVDKRTIGQLNHSAVLTIHQVCPNGTVTIHSSSNLYALADSQGQVPLPPYIKRPPVKADTTRYQTVFAKTKGSVAAPTASLNLTRHLLQKLQNKGIQICYLTLHVGLGTFQPIREVNVEVHRMHSEWFHLPTSTIQAIRQAKATGHSITAVGTTVTRTLEHVAKKEPNLFQSQSTNPSKSREAGRSGEADIFIYPGYKFQVIDHLLTNFHAPRSTVLMLTAAFASWPHLQHAYQEALAHDYQFLSYGDSTLIL